MNLHICQQFVSDCAMASPARPVAKTFGFATAENQESSGSSRAYPSRLPKPR
jgi:hypothetical protein